MEGSFVNKNDITERNITYNALLNTFSICLLQPLLYHSYLPVTKSSISPANIIPILNDVVLNGRSKILEFGAGMSTILLARLIKINRLSSTIISIEHDANFIEVLQSIVKNEELTRIIRFVHAPLVECPVALDQNLWYDVSILDKNLSNEDLFDLVIVDGPPAHEVSKNRVRYPALPYIYPKIAKEFSMYLDDAERAGEQFIISKWKEDFRLDFRTFYGTLGCFYRGGSYNLDVVKLSYLNQSS